MSYLASKGSEQTIKTFRNHGCKGELFGVKVGDLKPLQKKIKVNHQLANELYESRNSDAQYLAGLIADPKLFTEEQFENWANGASWHMISDYVLAWNLAESPLCWQIATKWIDSEDEQRKTAAWSAMASNIGITDNDQLNFEELERLLDKIQREILTSEDRVRYTMNTFLIALGGGIPQFTDKCIALGEQLGKLQVNMGKTACTVPFAPQYILTMKDMGRIGKKKKTAKC
jgi:3-methyladenine DNA glycosylase AlkD